MTHIDAGRPTLFPAMPSTWDDAKVAPNSGLTGPGLLLRLSTLNGFG